MLQISIYDTQVAPSSPRIDSVLLIPAPGAGAQCGAKIFRASDELESVLSAPFNVRPGPARPAAARCGARG